MAEAAEPRFSDSVSDVYAQLMVPMYFEPYAREVARRLAGFSGRRVLEIAAGTGVVTRALADVIDTGIEIVATDLNAAMLERARTEPIARPVDWRVADAMQLPFEDASFDLVVCVFGVMFFPDRAKGYAEMRRVLQPHGRIVVLTWDRLAENELSNALQDVLRACFPADPPRLFEHVAHAYFDPDEIRRDLAAGGFASQAAIEIVPLRSRLGSAGDVATALCLGTPLRHELERRDRPIESVIELATAALARFAAVDGSIDAKMQALVLDVAR